MPELPEVEVTRAALAPTLAGASVLLLRLGKPLRWPLGCPPQALAGWRLGAMQRRAKYLWLPMAPPGSADAVDATVPGAGPGLLWHLGMSGALQIAPDGPTGAHDHVELHTTAGLLRLTDPRRFGAVVWTDGTPGGAVDRLLAGLGPEPFDAALTPQRFHAALAAKRTPVKAALLAGDLVVGAGNIYACEALFIAGIHPATPCRRLGPARAQRLLAAVRQVLGAAIAAGGSTLRDYRDPHGSAGAYQAQRLVYDREGLPCTRCGTTVRRRVMAQRSTYFCPGCQHG